MLKSISYIFPQNTPQEKVFFTTLSKILAATPNNKINSDSIILSASNPKNALPTTILYTQKAFFPEIRFDDGKDLSLQIGNLWINGHLNKIPTYQIPIHDTQYEDALGPYTERKIGTVSLFRLPIEELYKRLEGHIVRLDHTGINIPSTLITHEDWQMYLHKLAGHTNLYNYPTGEEWPFVLPATKDEFEHNITHFPTGREPKIELVYDTYSPIPTIQIDLETDLTRNEVATLFPKPYGIAYPGVAAYFRTVYLSHDWPGLNIRFDIRYINTTPEGDWETGKWLVNKGGRI